MKSIKDRSHTIHFTDTMVLDKGQEGEVSGSGGRRATWPRNGKAWSSEGLLAREVRVAGKELSTRGLC